MASKPKAPRWLTEAFRDGVDERELLRPFRPSAPYPGADVYCWLAHSDPAERTCSGPMERFHFIPRQRVENALGALLPDRWTASVAAVFDPEAWTDWRAEIILLAAWDQRNGGLGCEHHHRRFDGHAVSARAPKIIVPFPQLPSHVYDYVDDFGFRGSGWLTERFPA